MSIRKKEIKRIVFVFIFVALILLSNLQTFNNLSPIINNEDNDSPFNKENDEFPLSSNSNLNLTDYITGNGNNQTVRFYTENLSYSLNNQEYFNITAPAQNTYLSSGDFNFTFQKNYTTEHVLEDDDALYPDSGLFIEKYHFNYNETYSSITINPGMNLTEGGLNNLTDVTPDTYWILNSSSNGRLNFTICANFSKILGGAHINFNRSNIAGLLLFLSYNLSMDANLTIKMKDFNTNIWKNVTNTVFINSSNPLTQEIDERIINENLNFISESNCCLVQIIFNRTDLSEFNVILYDFNLSSVVLFEIPITNTSYVALEFDLRGYNTTVNGFYAWIRTSNLSEAVNAILNITLYKSNATIVRTEILEKENLVPDYASKIDSILVKYSNDNLSYFKFNLSNTSNLILYNYFIVIKSNSSKNIFSLVTIPCDGDFGDSKTEHQLKNTTNCGINWTNAKKSIGSYTSKQLDASSFKLNVTRGYMPSDFLVNSLITLKIDNVSLVNQKIEASPYNGSIAEAWEWGKGRWNNDFSEAIKDGIDDKFRVNLTWNENVTKGFLFNILYRAKSYNIENATCMYNITYNGIPNWILNYTLDLNKFPNWNFTEFWYIYPTYLDPHNLTTPNNEQVFSQTGGKEIFSENPNYNKTVITTAIIEILQPNIYNGSYLLNLTSFNCMLDVHSYINFKGNLWETNGFMYGDNISVSADIQDHDGLAPPNNGHANVTLYYYPNGTRYFTDELYSTEGKKSSDNSMLSYDFNNQTILNLTSNTIRHFGKYYLGYFWTNGSAIGAKKMEIYIDTYEIDVMDCDYYPNNNYNVLQGTIDNKVLNTYSLLTASINETTGIYTPDFYPLSNLSVNKLFSYNYLGEEFQVSLKTFKQNETVLNPNETINFRISIQNLHEISDVNVKLKIKLVSLANNEWIIAENISNPIKLRFNGHENDIHDFNINLTMPTLDPITKIWKGINAPVRFAGAKAIVTVYIENNAAGNYESNDYSVLINKTENIFEGYIMALKIDNEISSATLTKTFERNECIYLPNNSLFILNIYDRYSLSSYDPFIKQSPLKLDSEFINISINPEAPIYGKTLELTSILTNEFGDTLSYQSVTCQYYNKDNSWMDLDSSKLTDVNGSITFTIDTMSLEIDENLLLRLTWLGNNSVLSNYKNIPINLTMQSNDFSIIFDTCDNPVIYRNLNSSLIIYITNTGNSTLKILNINFDIDDDLKYTIKEINYLQINHLEPGETTRIIIEIEVLNVDFNLLNITVSITGKNIISAQKINQETTVSLNVLDCPIIDFLLGFLIIIALALIALFWVSTFFYAKKVIKKIETPIEEVVEKRPRKGKYVKISDLKTEEKAIDLKEKKIEKPPREKKADKKKITDLDSLLKEKKLDADKMSVKKDKPKEVKKKEIIPKKIDKKKDKDLKVDKKLVKKDKPTEVKSKKLSPKKLKKETIDLKNLNKWTVKKLKEFCKENNIKIQSQAKKSQIIKILKKSLSEEKKEGKITDFDSLLKEKGLNDKK